uniref:Uncharacterized protein n=1 Tax=Cacopsylla melanoneura TaxID=428564 RepID=A0A8D8VY21_9HEMI
MGKPHGGLFFHNTKTHGSKQSPELRRTRYSPWENPMVVYFSIIQKHMGRNKIQNYVVYSIHTYIIVHGKNPMVVQFFHNSPRITHMVVGTVFPKNDNTWVAKQCRIFHQDSQGHSATDPHSHTDHHCITLTFTASH